jgi:hypothetical protein
MRFVDVNELAPGRLMDELIVWGVLGWKIEKKDGYHRLEDREGKIVGGWDAPPQFKHELDPKHRFSPSTNMIHTKRVVKKMHECGWYLRLLWFDYACEAEFSHSETGAHKEAWGDTPEQAICRAALLVLPKGIGNSSYI